MLAHSARGQNIILRFFSQQKNDRPKLNFGYMNFHNDRSLESCTRTPGTKIISTTKQGVCVLTLFCTIYINYRWKGSQNVWNKKWKHYFGTHKYYKNNLQFCVPQRSGSVLRISFCRACWLWSILDIFMNSLFNLMHLMHAYYTKNCPRFAETSKVL